MHVIEIFLPIHLFLNNINVFVVPRKFFLHRFFYIDINASPNCAAANLVHLKSKKTYKPPN